MSSALSKLVRLLEVLDERGWTRLDPTQRHYRYQSPAAGDFVLYVPRDPATPSFERALDYTLASLAEHLQLPVSGIEGLLAGSSSVLSLRLSGGPYDSGAAPLSAFERVLDHLKLAISRTVTFLVTDDPVAKVKPAAVNEFLERSWFLQTQRGSFVTRVALPTSGDLKASPTFWQKSIENKRVGIALATGVEVLTGRVIAGDESVFTEPGFSGIESSLSLGMAEEITRLFKASGAGAVDLAYGQGETAAQRMSAELGPASIERLEEFVHYASLRWKTKYHIDVVGRVLELRGSRRKGKGGYVGILAEDVNQKPSLFTFRAKQSDYDLLSATIAKKQSVQLRGLARNMRTQVRVEDELEFSVIE